VPPDAAAEIVVPPLDLTRPRRIHIVGIGGVGMSAIALLLARMGHTVSGSDLKESVALARLDVEQDWDEIAELIEDSYRLTAPKRVSALLDRPDPKQF